jgi:hypothetical protein
VEATRLCKKGVARRLLAAACTIIVTLIPSPDERKVRHSPAILIVLLYCDYYCFESTICLN